MTNMVAVVSVLQHPPRQRPAPENEQERAGSANPRSLGDGKDAEIDSAHHPNEQHNHSARPAQIEQALPPALPFAARAAFRVQQNGGEDREHEKAYRYQARQHRGHEKLADIRFCDDAVDDERRAWRNENSEGPA